MMPFDQVMEQVFQAVREDRLPVAYQFSAAWMIHERQVPDVAEWLADATEVRIRKVLKHIVCTGSWCEEAAVIRAIRRVQQEKASDLRVRRGQHVTRSVISDAPITGVNGSLRRAMSAKGFFMVNPNISEEKPHGPYL